ncbi:MAG TPA: hypothetical protein VFM65_08335 [Flavobacteriaceae bacterium]|nr:hypothetical protein [Flavobacteriaceae bacterium]
MNLLKIFAVVGFFVLSVSLSAQPKPKINGFNTYVPTFTTYQEQMAGKTEVEYIGIGINKIKGNTHIPNWTLRVRALGNYINQSNPSAFVQPQFTFLQFNTVTQAGMAPVNTNPVSLSTSETVLVSGAPPLDPQISGGYIQYRFDYIIQGGNHLLVPNGDYRVSLEFSLYDGNNILIDRFVLNNVGFQIQSGNYGTNTLMLQNSADIISMQFDNVSDYYTGVSVTKPLGLKVKYQGANEIFVKTTSSQLTSTTTSNTIPVSLIKLELSQTQKSLPNLVFSPPTGLSTSETSMVQNPHSNQTYNEVEYNLEYSVSASDAANVFGEGATYTTNVIFIVLPQ